MVQMLEGLTGTQDANVGHGIKGDAWFRSVRAAAALGVRGHRAVMQVKTNSSLFPKKFIADTLDGMTHGVRIVLKGTTPNEVCWMPLGIDIALRLLSSSSPQRIQDTRCWATHTS